MLSKFVPNKRIKHFNNLDIDWLKAEQKKLLLCDIDNTLVAPDDPHHNEDVVSFIKRIQDAGLEVVLISNNTEERVSLFNEGLNLKTYPMALKPFKKTYKKIKKDYSHLDSHEMISLGDQVMTDVFGSNRSKIDIVLVNQIVERDMIHTWVNRSIEKIIVKLLTWRGKWPDEEM